MNLDQPYFKKYGECPEEKKKKEDAYYKAMDIESSKFNKEQRLDEKRMGQDLKDFKNRTGDYKPANKDSKGDSFYDWNKRRFVLYSELTELEQDMFTEQGFEAHKNHSHNDFRQLVND